jgi:hypothetical protein
MDPDPGGTLITDPPDPDPQLSDQHFLLNPDPDQLKYFQSDPNPVPQI